MQMRDISYYKTETNGDELNMVLIEKEDNIEDTVSIEHYKDTIRKTVEKQLEEQGYTYCNEATKYMLTGESTVDKNSEVRLLEDQKYLLKKIALLEDFAFDLMKEREFAEFDKKYPQTDVFGKKVKRK